MTSLGPNKQLTTFSRSGLTCSPALLLLLGCRAVSLALVAGTGVALISCCPEVAVVNVDAVLREGLSLATDGVPSAGTMVAKGCTQYVARPLGI